MSARRSPFALLASVAAAFACSVVIPACDGGDSEDDATTMEPTTMEPAGDESGGETAAAGEGRCSPDNAALACEQTDCAFDTAEVDCVMACANIAALCANNGCEAQCSGLESDAAICGASCEATKGLSCTNVVFGCYTSNMGCDDVGACVDANE